MKNILITGASQGIGFELAKQFAKNDNFNLYLVSRNKKKLEKLKLELNKINSNVNSYLLSIDLLLLEVPNSHFQIYCHPLE